MAILVTINSVLELLHPMIQNGVNLRHKSRQEAKTLESNLRNIKQLVDDAERRQLKDRLIKDWLENLQDVAYDIEDVLEEWEAKRKLQQLQYEEEEKQNAASNLSMREKVCQFMHSPCSCFDRFFKNRTIALEIKDLNQRVSDLYKEGIDRLELNQLRTTYIKVVGSMNGSEGSSYNWRTTAIGRENDKANLRKMLVSYAEVICIVGQGGLGKTTLAKMMYHDDEVTNEFPSRMWVCVSDPFKELDIAKSIVEQLEGRPLDIPLTPDALMRRVKNRLAKNKFLLVLDGAWIEESEEWVKLKPYLRYGAKGSKILVTARKEQTVMALGASKSYHLEKMGDEDCWSIIRQIALPSTDEGGNYLRLEKIGRKLAEKCDGLPLAARILGGLLKNKRRNVKDWRKVLESEIWELENHEEDKLFRHLFLSYNELEPVAKCCFSYCAAFPKDFEIEVKDLIRIWMAQGFLSSSSNNATSGEHQEGDWMEAKGYSYFTDLAQRSFLQDSREELTERRVVYCKMHDTVHDFAQYLSRNHKSFAPPRHLWWPRGEKLESGRLVSGDNNTINAEKLRSLFCSKGTLPMDEVVLRLKRVRALSLADCGFEEIPEEIGNLIHLRFLDLSGNKIKELPESICNLCHLQTLVLEGCDYLTRFPQGISKLRNLRHLIFDEPKFKYPPGLASLTNLQKLTDFHVRWGHNSLRYLKDLNQLRGRLEISLEDTENVEAAEAASLWKKTFIDTLHLKYDEVVKLRVVEALRPHPQLQSLTIDTTGLRIPSWIAGLENLRELVIFFRPSPERVDHEPMINRSSLPVLWKLPYLEHFEIRGDWFMEQWVGNGFYGLVSGAINRGNNTYKIVAAFPALKKLELSRGYSWRDWNEMSEEEEEKIRSNNIIIMPRLTELCIHRCNQLETLPNRALQKLPSLKTLSISRCSKLEEKYSDASTSILHSHIPNVIFEN